MRVFFWLSFVAAFISLFTAGSARALGAEATLVKILAADATPEDPNLFEPDGDGIVDRAHFRLLDRVLGDASTPHHAEILAIWNANRAQVADDNNLTFECVLLERLLKLTCEDFEVYGASQITIGDATGNARIERLLDTVGIVVGLDNYDVSASVWLAAEGDLDGDGFSNVEEYDAVCGDFDAFVSAAVDPLTTPESLFCCGLCPLDFDELPVGADKYVGESLALSVLVVNAEDTPQYTWLRDGAPTGVETQTLNIASLSVGDAGDYQCRVSDGGETITTPLVTVRVSARMEITQQPLGVMLYRGEPLSLRVAVAGGLAPLGYSWTRGTVAVGTDSPEYRVGSVGPGAAGVYRCTVVDAREVLASAGATVVVGDHMRADVQPQSQTVLRGSDATFRFDVSFGLGTLTYAWFRNGEPVGDGASSLALVGVGAEDAGSYQCVALDAREELASELVTLSVVEALTITEEPVGARKLTGASHTFSVTAMGGVPPVAYRWFKDGSALNTTTTSLTLNALNLASAGRYWCVVSDAQGSVESARVALEVFAPLRIVTQPEGASKLVGSAHTLSIAVSGGGGGEQYRWYRNGSPLDETGTTLAFAALGLDDSGEYLCEVSDEFTTVRSAVAVITVAANLLITQQPLGAAKYAGEAHSFSVAATGGLNTLTYRWLKDGAPTDVTDRILALNTLSPADSGTYQCVVSDGVETARSSTAHLEVADHLAITSEPLGARLLIGEALALRVETLGGLGKISYRWFQDQDALDVDSPNLVVNAVTLGDAGVYRCEIRDDFESVTTGTAAVVVAEPLRFVVNPQSTVRALGEAISFEVATVGGLGNVSYAWFRDDAPLNVGTTLLSILDLAKADAGAYVCVATDERGATRSAVAQLRIITPLQLDAPLADLTALEGETVSLTVFASGGDAPLEYQWYKGDVALEATGPSISFSPLQADDAGEYRCMVSDGFQSTESNVAVVVALPRLAITQDPVGATLTLGDSILFVVAASGGLGEYRYAWSRDGESIPGTTAQLSLRKVGFDDAGEYTCAVSDDFDTRVSLAATLIVLPEPAGILTVSPANGASIDFGNALLGQAIEREVLLRNTGNAPLTFALRVAGDPQFSAIAIAASPTLAPGAEIVATLTFQPIVAGVFDATLQITPDDGPPTILTLRGTATTKGFWACGGGGGTTGNTLADLGDWLLLALLLGTLTSGRLLRNRTSGT